jgi:hypothetical protein
MVKAPRTPDGIRFGVTDDELVQALKHRAKEPSGAAQQADGGPKQSYTHFTGEWFHRFSVSG